MAASLAIEQVGMPVVSVDERGKERWNGVLVGERMKELESRSAGGDEGLASGLAGVSI